MSMMDVCGPVFCPECPPWRDRRGERRGERLKRSDSNYSGTGTDMANCPKCGKGFCISYKIDEVTRCEDWDVDLEEEQKANIEGIKAHAADLRKKADEAAKEAEEAEKRLTG